MEIKKELYDYANHQWVTNKGFLQTGLEKGLYELFVLVCFSLESYRTGRFPLRL
jgi:hypothetical protein